MTVSNKSKYDLFKPIYEAVEDIEDYVQGGYHPCYVGDTIGEEYQIVRKLGHGSYSTVWLAFHRSQQSFAAIKILKSKLKDANELKVYDRLQSRGNLNTERIAVLIEHFTLQGPNGAHQCIVYECLGPSISSMLMYCDDLCIDETIRLTLDAARSTVYQVLEGLEAMHKNGIVHGDISPANVLITLEAIKKPVSKLIQDESMVSTAVERLKGSTQPGDPKFLTLNCPLVDMISSNSGIQVKIADFGNAFLMDSPPTDLQTPLDYRSPELIVHKHATQFQDVWALGCLIYSLFASGPLVELWAHEDTNGLDDDHLLQLIALFGPLPASLRSSWPRYPKYFDRRGKQTRFAADYQEDDLDETDSVSDIGTGGSRDIIYEAEVAEHLHPRPDESYSRRPKRPKKQPLHVQYPGIFEILRKTTQDNVAGDEFVPPQLTLDEKWSLFQRKDLPTQEAVAMLDLMQRIFQWEIEHRATVEDILQHSWIQTYCIT